MVLWLSVLGSKISGFHLLRYKLWGLGFPKVLSNTSILWFSLINLIACSWIRMFFKVKNVWSWIWVGPPQRIWMVENQPYQWERGCNPLTFTSLPPERHLHNYGNSSESENSANYCLSQFLNLLFECQIVREIPSLLREHWFSQILSERTVTWNLE